MQRRKSPAADSVVVVGRLEFKRLEPRRQKRVLEILLDIMDRATPPPSAPATPPTEQVTLATSARPRAPRRLR